MKKLLILAATTLVCSATFAEVPKSIASDNEHLLVQPKFVIGTQNSTAVSYGVLPAKDSSWTADQCRQFVFVMDFNQLHGSVSTTVSGKIETGDAKDQQITHSLSDVARLNIEQTLYQGSINFPAKIDGKMSEVKTQVTYVEDTRTLERKGFWNNQYCTGLLAILPGRTRTTSAIGSN